MHWLDYQAFSSLFNEVVRKGFGHPLDTPLSEPQCRHLSLIVEEQTGLVIGWRSLKNYAASLLQLGPNTTENPSQATLDTLARYVLDAPMTTEAERKRNGETVQYWFRFREQAGPMRPPKTTQKPPIHRTSWLFVALTLVILVAVVSLIVIRPWQTLDWIETDFKVTDEATLRQQHWFVQQKNSQYWNQRAMRGGGLTLFTLKGDNWPQTGETVHIQNLLLRTVRDECFQTEVHFQGFVPVENWQQAGLLLLEDTLFQAKSIRLSLGYNSYFGGLARPGEIRLQAISSNGRADRHFEEFLHQPLFSMASVTDRQIAVTNLKHVALRVEKQGRQFRFLYSASPFDNFSFKEVARYESAMIPRYVGLFALKGYVETTDVRPAQVLYFRLEGQNCTR